MSDCSEAMLSSYHMITPMTKNFYQWMSATGEECCPAESVPSMAALSAF